MNNTRFSSLPNLLQRCTPSFPEGKKPVFQGNRKPVRRVALNKIGPLMLSVLLLAQLAKATFIPVTVTGFNADVVANGIGSPMGSTIIPFDTSANAYVLVAPDYQLNGASALPTYALPASGAINSVATAGLSYQLGSYTTSNSLRLVGTGVTSSGTLTFPTPNYIVGDVYILAAAAGGTANISVTLNFTSGGFQNYTTTVSNWIGGSNFAIQGIGRASRTTGALDAVSGATDPRLYEIHVPLSAANLSETIQSITIQRTGGSSATSVLNVMAVSVDNQNCLPPTGLAASNITTSGANVSWTAVTGAAGYEYAVTTSSTPPASGTAQVGNTASVTPLQQGTTYFLHVRTDCGSGFSGWSTISFKTPKMVNLWAAVKNFDNCNNRVIVDDCTGYKVGDTVLIIQMKTFSVDSTNTPTFGDTLAYNGAGNYEYNVIRKIFPNCEFELKYNVKRTYQWTLGRVQIVKVAYSANNYDVNYPVVAMPWDDNLGKGGVIAIRAANSITLFEDVNANGAGFRGGQPLYAALQSCNKTDYFYGPTGEGGEKGEGFGYLSVAKNYGRGKLTNGGGGGANSKSGGGGGGNGGAGGNGGDQFQAAIWCTQNLLTNIGGIGGAPVNYNNIFNRIILGGGGGAGAGDQQGEIAGGSGGGIVILDAPTVIGNNHLVTANGANAPECSGPGAGCQDDGGGGGGAGGTILINASNVNNLLQVSAKGGKGADVYEQYTVNATYMTGPGGGGGGGVAWFKTAATPAGVTVNTSAGNRGVLPQFFGSPNGSQNGNAGKTVNDLVLSFPIDTFKIKYPLDFKDSVISCATRQFINLTTVANGVQIFAWWWNFGDGDTAQVKNPPAHTFPSGGIYTITLAAQDITGCTDTFTRDIVVANLTYSISDTILGCRTHQFLATKTIDSSIFPNAVKFQWEYGDGDTGSGNPSVHTYDTGGLYTVVLTVTDSSGCTDTTHFTADVSDAAAGFTVSDDTVCQGQQILFTDASASTSIFYAWNFGEGTIDSSQNPNIIYPFEGSYVVRQIVGNITGCLDTEYHLIVVDSISPVDYVPSDTVLCEGQTVILDGYYIKDNSLGADWDLGDGFTAVDVDPVVHAYDTSGIYNVTLTVHFRACPDITFAKLITINPFPVLDLGPDTTMCPNGPAIVLGDYINVSNPQARWLWSTGDSANTIHVLHPGVYSAKVDVNGCVTNDSIEVFKDCYIDIPNAFSPNNDGSNDYFLPRQLLSKSIAKFSMTIYDRWGQEIFKTNSINGRGWDGKFNGKDQPFGVYVYRIDLTYTSGSSESYTGNVTLVR